MREILAPSQASQVNQKKQILAEHSAAESVSLPQWGGLIHPVEGAEVGKSLSAWEMSNSQEWGEGPVYEWCQKLSDWTKGN